MTIQELRELYPETKYRWQPMYVKSNVKFLSWNYKDNDIVITYRVEEVKSKDITDMLFKKNGKVKVLNEKVVKLEWRKEL